MQLIDRGYIGQPKYPYKMLMKKELPEDVDDTHKEVSITVNLKNFMRIVFSPNLRSFTNIKPIRTVLITPLFTDFYIANMSFNVICENKIIAKISKFTVINEFLVLLNEHVYQICYRFIAIQLTIIDYLTSKKTVDPGHLASSG